MTPFYLDYKLYINLKFVGIFDNFFNFRPFMEGSEIDIKGFWVGPMVFLGSDHCMDED